MEFSNAAHISDALHWSARITTIFFFALLALFLTGEGPPPIASLTLATGLELLSLALVFIGYAIGWRRPIMGGALSLLGVAAVHGIELVINRKLAGWAFSFLAIPGALYVAAGFCGLWGLAKRR